MKKLAYALLLSASGLVAASSDVWAGATANGNQCVPLTGTSGVSFGSNGIQNNNSTTISVSCPVEIDHLLGATVTFRVSGFDNSSTQNFSCTGIANNQDASTVGTSAPMTALGTGAKVLTSSPTTVSPQSASNIYFVNCTMPGGGSVINTVRVQ